MESVSSGICRPHSPDSSVSSVSSLGSIGDGSSGRESTPSPVETRTQVIAEAAGIAARQKPDVLRLSGTHQTFVIGRDSFACKDNPRQERINAMRQFEKDAERHKVTFIDRKGLRSSIANLDGLLDLVDVIGDEPISHTDTMRLLCIASSQTILAPVLELLKAIYSRAGLYEEFSCGNTEAVSSTILVKDRSFMVTIFVPMAVRLLEDPRKLGDRVVLVNCTAEIPFVASGRMAAMSVTANIAHMKALPERPRS